MTTTKKPAKTKKDSPGPTSSKPKTKKPSQKQKGGAKKTDEKLVTIDRRKVDQPVATERRKKVARRRQIDPTTCERDYTPDEIEFMNALDEYKRTSGRMFPTCSEVLEVVKNLGYAKPVLPVLSANSSRLQQPGSSPVSASFSPEFFHPAFV